MTRDTDPQRHVRPTTSTPKTALHRALARAEAAGDTDRAATLRALWPALDRRRSDAGVAMWPRHRERRRWIAPQLTIDDAMIEAWLRSDAPHSR